MRPRFSHLPCTGLYLTGANCYSLLTKLRLALLHERGDALFSVLAVEQRLHQRALGLEAFVQRPLDPAIHRELYGPDGLGRTASQILCVLASLLFQRVCREQPVEDAQPVSLRGRNRPSRHHEVERLAHPYEAWQALGAAVTGQQTQGRLREPQHVLALCAEAQVAGQGHLQPAAEGSRSDLGDEHLRGAGHLGEALVGPANHPHVVLDAVGVKRLDVRSGGEEPLAAAAQDHGSCPVVLCCGAHASAELLHERKVVAVRRRVVQGNVPYAAFPRILDGHVSSSSVSVSWPKAWS